MIAEMETFQQENGSSCPLNLISPMISIVIPTHNREAKLNALLQSIAECSLQISYEVIVVDDSDKRTKVYPEIRERLGQNLKIINIPNRIFISKAKNIGWRNALAEYIFFVDDDNVLPEGTAETLLKKLGEDTRIGALMPVVYYAQRPEVIWVYAAPFCPGRWKFDLIGRNSVEIKKPAVDLIPTDALPNASMIRRSVLERIGGIDESLPVNSSCDLCQKIKKAGYETFALTTAQVLHQVTPPDTSGYWAEHASEDSQRRYYEVRDWFDLMARLHRDEEFLVLKEFLRSMQFLFAVGLGVLLHPTRRKQSLLSIYYSMIRGLKDGVKVAARSG